MTSVLEIEAFPNTPGADYRTRRYVVSIDERALLDLEVDEGLRAALYECETSYSVADKILSLWFLAQRLERATPPENRALAGPILPQILLLPRESMNEGQENTKTGEGLDSEASVIGSGTGPTEGSGS